MRRREFVTVLGAGAVAPVLLLAPLVARAQQNSMPVIGFLSGRSPDEMAHLVSAFRLGLADVGYSEGKNVAIEYRWAENHTDRLSAMAAELIARPVAVIVATGGNNSALTAKGLTGTIPIIFTSGNDPVAVGLVASINRPESNVTGVSWFSSQLTAKGLGLMHELLPGAAVVALLLNPRDPESRTQPNDARVAVGRLAQKLLILEASTADEIDAAFTKLVAQDAQTLVIAGDPFLTSRRNQIAALAARHRLPSIGFNRDWAEAGALMSYGNNLADSYRKAGMYTGRILRGTRPAELPVEQASKFELIINMKTAKALGVNVPNSLQLLADEVIE
jgi:putative ABC transport system substrate-binding protein